jgi:hypothetical protein
VTPQVLFSVALGGGKNGQGTVTRTFYRNIDRVVSCIHTDRYRNRKRDVGSDITRTLAETEHQHGLRWNRNLSGTEQRQGEGLIKGREKE